MKTKNILFAAAAVAIIVGVGVYAFGTKKAIAPVEVKTDKATYTNASGDLIVVDTPFPGAVTGKEFSVMGKARGTWYFEASFPVEVLDKNGKSLATGIAHAQGDWMTESFVPFKADIKVPESYIGLATLVLKKDNPSGMIEKDASVSFPFTIEY